ncbi:MAG: TatD family hydrolase [Thermoplasmata archaeon]|nr:TatD family hydrolase [Thermoplasmata archaeon]
MTSFDPDREDVVLRAIEAGVRFIINPGINLESTLKAIKLSEKHEEVFAAGGLHPHNASEESEETLEAVSELAASGSIVAIGEIGLDYYRQLAPVRIQRKVFAKYIELGLEQDLPLILHIREAFDDTLSILKNSRDYRGVAHCFSGNVDEALKLLQMGFMISFAGQITYPNAQSLCEVVRNVPMEKLLIETDAPYLAPQQRRGKRNEPAFVTHVAEKVAAIKECTVDEIARRSTENAAALFDLPPSNGQKQLESSQDTK